MVCLQICGIFDKSKKMKSIFFLVFILIASTSNLKAQYKCSYIDVFGVKHDYPTPILKSFGNFYSKPEAYDSLPESEIVTAKQILKQLDLQDKLNKSIFSSKKPKEDVFPLFDILVQGVVSGKITAFKQQVYKLDSSNTFSCDKLIQKLIRKDSIESFFIDENGNETFEKRLQTDTISAVNIKSILFNEVWYFNKKMARLEKRIISIAPVWNNPKTNKDEVIFWIYYNEAREWLASFPSYSKFVDGTTRSYEQLFFNRFFNSKIVKESNVFDKNLLENTNAFDALMKSESVKDEILIKEEGMWEK